MASAYLPTAVAAQATLTWALGSSALAIVLLCVGPATAQEPRAAEPAVRTYVATDTLEVTAKRPSREQVLALRAGFATVHELATDASRPVAIPEIIERGAGVHIRRYGGLGAYSVASVRGSAPGQVEVYLDGAPLRSGQWGVTELSELPVAGIERVEVFRGMSPVEFGGSPIGGVVHLVTRSPDRASVAVRQTAGSYETWRSSLAVSGRVGSLGAPLGPVAASLSVSRLSSRGDFEYLNRNGTPENAADDAVIRRRNNHLEQTNALLRLVSDPSPGWTFALTDELLLKGNGIPGIENVPIVEAHADAASNLLRVTAETPPWPLSGRLGAWHSVRRDRFYNPADEVGLHRTDTIDRTTTFGVDGRATAHWHAARQTLTAFASLRGERYVPEDTDPRIGKGFTRKRTTVIAALEDRLRVFSGRLELAAAFRHISATDNYTGPPPFGSAPEELEELHVVEIQNPSLGMRVTPCDWVTVKAGVAESGRLPTMLEAFGSSGTVEGNTELGPETATSVDGGVVLAPWRGRLFVEATVFHVESEDLIVFLQNSQRTVKAFNLESAETDGAELSLRCELGAGWSVAGAYTRLDAVNTGPSPVYHGKLLPYTPEHELFARAAWSDGTASLWYEHRWMSETWRDRANLPENRAPARHLANAGFRFALSKGLALSAEIVNAGNERTADVAGFPLPGRSAYVTLEYSWMGEKR